MVTVDFNSFRHEATYLVLYEENRLVLLRTEIEIPEENEAASETKGKACFPAIFAPLDQVSVTHAKQRGPCC